MHELSICNALIEQIESIAHEQAAGKVAKIVLRIGPLAGIEPELLRQAYPLAAAGTVAADAILVIETADVTVRCTRCGSESKVAPNRMLCSACGDFRTRVIRGDEMILQTVELENCGAHRKDSDAGARRMPEAR